MRIIYIGAHPDDCEIGFGGTASKAAAMGHAVKFLSVTNGAAGHHLHSLERTAAIRKVEAHHAARRLGIAEAHAEAFQVCEYGRRPTREEMEEIFPR